MPSAVYESTKTAYKALIGNCLHLQREFFRCTPGPSNNFLKDFCTLRLSCSRRLGHTVACTDLMYDREWFKNPLYLARTGEMAKDVWQCACKRHLDGVRLRHRFISMNVHWLPIDCTCDAVFVDHCHGLEQKEFDRLYDLFGPSARQRLEEGKTFIFVFIQ